MKHLYSLWENILKHMLVYVVSEMESEMETGTDTLADGSWGY